MNMLYITIENPVTETKTTKTYKTESGATKAYAKACEDSNNFVSMFRYATGNEIHDTLVKSNN